MVWVKIDDGFSEHPKIAKVGAIGAWIQIQALCYSNRNLTDGFLPESIAKNFGLNGTAHIGIATAGVSDGNGRMLAEVGLECNEVDWPAEMVACGLWEVVDHGYLIHDFLVFNPSKEEVLKKRKKDVIRKDSTRNPSGIQTDSKRPVPGPVPVDRTPPLPPSRGERVNVPRGTPETRVGKGTEKRKNRAEIKMAELASRCRTMDEAHEQFQAWKSEKGDEYAFGVEEP